MIRGAVTNQVHGKPVGTTASWSNPGSGNSGSIKLAKKRILEEPAMRRPRIYGALIGPPGYTEHYHFTSCLQPDGTWKIA